VKWIASGGGRSWESTGDWLASWRQTAGVAAVGCRGWSLGAERGGRGTVWLWEWLTALIQSAQAISEQSPTYPASGHHPTATSSRSSKWVLVVQRIWCWAGSRHQEQGCEPHQNGSRPREQELKSCDRDRRGAISGCDLRLRSKSPLPEQGQNLASQPRTVGLTQPRHGNMRTVHREPRLKRPNV